MIVRVKGDGWAGKKSVWRRKMTKNVLKEKQ